MKNKTLKVGVVAAVLGALIQLSDITRNWPSPLDFLGSLIIFSAVLLMAVDIIYRRR